MSDVLPQGWATARIEDVIQNFQPGFASGKKDVMGGVPHLRMNNIGITGGLVLDLVRTVPENLAKSRHELRPGDVLVCTTNSGKLVGKCAFFDLPGRYAFSNHLTRLRPNEALVDGRFLRWGLWLQWKSGAYEEQCKHWVNQSTLPKEALLQAEIPVAPLEEQRRIAAKLELLLGKVDACQRRLEKIPALLKRFRQSILANACSGRLTADWRRKNASNCNAEADLNSYLHDTQSLRPRTRDAEPTEGHEILTEQVPDDWAIPSLDQVFRFIDYRGKTPTKSQSGKRLISAKNIKMGYISEEPIEFVSDDFYKKWMVRGFPKPSDIFFVTEGHTMGFTALNTRTDEFALSQRTITLQPWQPIETRAFFYFIMSPLFQKLVGLNATGSAAVGIKAAKLRSLPIPFPSLAEQHEIVRRVEQLFTLADQLETRYSKATAHVDKLAQSLLARAFSGKLVSQDPNDEPASALLERLSSESAKSKRTGRRK